MTDSRVVGIVLAGGASRRFGSDKLGADLAGRPVILHAERALRRVPEVGRVVVVGPAAAVDRPWLRAVEAAGAQIVRDAELFGGPLAGLAVGLGALEPSDVALVVAGDMPFVAPAVLRSLAQHIRDGADMAVGRIAADRRPEPLPLALRAGPGVTATQALLTRGERRLAALLEELPRVAVVNVPDAGSLRDVDVPEDLEAARQ